jgi:uncharacterized protein involved in type VI secretion and phage assembly
MVTAQTLDIDTHLDRFYGKFRGLVTDNNDPIQAGRVQVSVPEVLGNVDTGWALPCTPYAGKNSGLYVIPPVGAPVWVEFEAGDPSRPIWSGGWWGPVESPGTPATPTADPSRRELVSESGLRVSLDDDARTLTVSDGSGQNLMTIEATTGKISVTALTEVVLEAPLINHGEGASQSAVLGDLLLGYLTEIVTAFNTHLHPGELTLGVLPVTPMLPVAPMVPPTPSLLSFKNFVE